MSLADAMNGTVSLADAMNAEYPGITVVIQTVQWARTPIKQLVQDHAAGWVNCPVSGDTLARVRVVDRGLELPEAP